ncbi:MAG: hypothetical protein K0A90_00030 [Methanosarcinaceae archaeon]|nr:hypothetical protein [Methanosarcinaceae archaeon]
MPAKIKKKKPRKPVEKHITPGRKALVDKFYIMGELTKLVESGQIIGLTQTALGEKYNVRRQTISNYLTDIYEDMPPEDINATRIKIQVVFDRLFREAQYMLAKSSSIKERRESVDLMLRVLDRFTAFLENFHIKEKATEKVLIGVEKQLILIRDTPTKIVDMVADDGADADNTNRETK